MEIDATRVSAPPRTDPGTGICTTAVHLNEDDLLTDAGVAEAYLAQTVGMNRVDGKVSFPYATVDFRNSDALASGDYRDDRPLPFTVLSGTPQTGNERNIAMRVRGYINIRRPGIYTFSVLADDGYRLRIGGVEVLSSAGFASLRDSRQVDFKVPGLFFLELVYFQNGGPAILELAKADRADLETRHSPQRLGDSFKLVAQEELFSAVAGSSDCTECTGDAACGIGTGKYCRDGLCQRCIVASRCGKDCQACPEGQPVCNGERCVECNSANTRVCDARGFVCEQNTCRPCLADSECGMDASTGRQKICDVAFGQCIPRPPLRYTGGCSVSQQERGAAGGAGLVLLLVLLTMGHAISRRWRFCAGSLTLLAPLFATNTARAQDLSPEVATFNAQTFRPAVGPGNIFTVEGTLMPRRLFPFGGVLLQYAHRPLRLIVEGTDPVETYANVVPQMVTAHLMPGFGITRWLSLALDLPLVLYQGFDERTPAGDTNFLLPTVAGLGDLRLMTKFRILNNEDGGFGLAALPQLSFPTGSVASFRSENTVGIEPRVAADYRFKHGIFIALNLGFWLRTYNRNVDFQTVRVSDQLRYGLGVGAPLIKGFGVAGELAGAVSFSRLEGGPSYSPLEGLVGLRYTHALGIEATVGGGGAFIASVGTPQFRAFASIAFVPTGKKAQRPSQSDGAQPGQAANLDPDGDGVQGSADRCPDEAGPAENKGCPDRDHDQDGVPDRLDKCPKQAGVADNNGCPDSDEDQDGVPDRLDRCPAQAGVAQAAGCPEENPDHDQDGVPDNDDKCPMQPGTVEAGGCPDSDEDKDTIVDRLDRCPKQAGPKETGGCPVIEVSDTGVRLVLPIKFAPGSDQLERDSNRVILALARLMNEDKSIKKMTISVPASGDKKTAKKLAGKRAKNLLGVLVDTGVAKKRLAIKAAQKPGGDEITAVSLKKGKVKAKKEKKAKKGKRGKR